MKQPTKCTRCNDRLTNGVTGLCRPCFDARRIERAPKCQECGKRVGDKRWKRCPECCAKRREAMGIALSHGGVCRGCGGKCSLTSMSGLCRSCTGKAVRARHLGAIGQDYRDFTIEDAAKSKRFPVEKRCEKCGGKYNTKACVACAVKERVRK